ncbi:hypothetical protein PCANC_27002 [Puccinia coronata f. sp. avenae]|uniref:Uncharacterized protein n=1 Tax=Puccinia coronata f. sp. avenae TaxID=200324 RepID=A0A2N5UY61_9BASI|nr:hypothetical protein PCANC_27002 [Puccinia coronata f. sp. avenae]PLW42683.1 hypothetical protein PCASD_08488 [Puccinia coronata f. sp. avenae]
MASNDTTAVSSNTNFVFLPSDSSLMRLFSAFRSFVPIYQVASSSGHQVPPSKRKQYQVDIKTTFPLNSRHPHLHPLVTNLFMTTHRVDCFKQKDTSRSKDFIVQANS